MSEKAVIKVSATKSVGPSSDVCVYVMKYEHGQSYQGFVEWYDHNPSSPLGEPVAITHDMAQHLMDSLWDCGLRPTEGKGSAGALAATEAHLKDMQTLAFRGFAAMEKQAKEGKE